jgi:protein disulfide isomerase family A protein 3
MANRDQFKPPLLVVYYNVDYEKNVKTTNYIRNRVIKVAQSIQSENIKFAISNSKEFETELIETFGVASVDTIAVKYVMGVGALGEKYKFDGDFSVENLERFVRDLLSNKLEAYVKSEPVPDYGELRRISGEKVVRVVGKNFEQIVNDATKDVLIELYAPWY